MNNLFYILVTSFAIGVATLTYFYFADPSSGITTPVLGVAYIVFAAIFYGLNHLRKKSPRYFLGFIDWLDWKFFNGKGSDDFRGKKIFVLTVLGFIIGALVGKAGLGLIIGLFLGAATEY